MHVPRIVTIAALVVTWLGAQRPASRPGTFEEHDFPPITLGDPEEDSVEFAPDGSKAAYCVREGEKSACVLEDKVIGKFTFANAPLFAPDGAGPAWRVGDRLSDKAERWRMYVGEKKVWETDFIGDPAWGRDGRSLAWWVAPGTSLDAQGIYKFSKAAVVFGGKAGPEFRTDVGMNLPVISPDGKRVAYDVNIRGKGFVVVDGKSLKDHQLVDGPAFSADSKEVAYAFGTASGPAVRWSIVAGERRVGADHEGSGSPVYAPSGRTIAYKAEIKKRYHVVVEGQAPGPAYDGTGVPVFSPDGKRLAYAANVGGKPEPMGPSSPLTRLGEHEVPGGKWVVVVDAKPSEPFDRVADPAFSPDSQKLAFRAKSGNQWFLVVGAAKHGPFDDVGSATWSADSKKVAHGVRTGRKLRWLVHAVAE
jgi:Tol biopolymer transport system component